jgi:recombination protein RecA
MAAKKKTKTKKEDPGLDIAKALEAMGARLTTDTTDFKSPYYVDSGMYSVNRILGDEPGIPNGVIMYYGGENSGKTTVSLQALVSAQKQGLECFYFNQERAVNQSLIQCFPELDASKVNWITAPDGETCLDAIKHVLRTVKNAFCVLDSIPACQPKAVLEADTGKHFMAPLARIFTPFMADAKNLCFDNHSILLMINQKRENLDAYGFADKLPGGNALKHNCDIIVRFKVRGKIKVGEDVIGHTVEAETMKNRFQGKGKKATSTLIYGKGFSREYDVFEQALSFGLADKKGSWITIGEEKFQGVMGAIWYLEENPAIVLGLEAKLKDLLG